MKLIKKIFLIIIFSSSILSIKAQTEIIYDEFSRRVYANAGPDIKAYPNSTILLTIIPTLNRVVPSPYILQFAV